MVSQLAPEQLAVTPVTPSGSARDPFDSDAGEIILDSDSISSNTSSDDAVSEPTRPPPIVRRPPPKPPVQHQTVQTGQQDEIAPVISSLPEQEFNEKYQPEGSDVEADAVSPAVAIKEKTDETAPSDRNYKAGLFCRIHNRFRNTYCPKEEPPLVLPTCPNDDEKLSYIHTNRILLYAFGVFSFLSLGAGMWLFALSAPFFYWYGVFAGAMCIYLIISYGVGLIGKDWDYKAHIQRVDAYPITEESAPTVDIFLPCCSEPLEILENTYKHIISLDWPTSKLKVYVMDDSAQDAVRELAEKYGFIYHVRDDRPRLRKAGNLRWNFARTDGEYFVIFDADFCPRPDFVKELIVEHLDDDKTAIVQSPQWFRVTDDQTWVEQGAGATQELFYRVVQVNRNRWGASICVGSNAMYRRAALTEVGGTAEIGFSEDVHTGFGAVDRGWKVKYIPLCLATGVCPAGPRAFFSQQMRWARGSTTLLTNPHFWTSNLNFMQKLCYISGFLYYSAVSLNIFLSPIAGTLLLAFRSEWFKAWNLAFALPSIFYGIVVFKVWTKASYGFSVQHVMVIMSYAYLTAIKDRMFNIELLWAASGDSKAHKSNKYRNMRILCWLWTIIVTGAMAGVVTWKLLTGFTWYHTLPLMIINLYNFYIAHRFLFCNW
ncbi:related to cellulose synthase catalytic subunit [UDP-forming] [Fusarium mangiferae]|uniref:Related to cellulose synthase catalytic subunit [UDP-forming] n=1 Tax=Fusarium mangiferae TaxID=192010 RepID=A0A1L7TP36_FUSMA|nr:uncharacterized protein FMAN_09831 [Fusarium mangiferae]CVL00354.1 related to cellulose synthase catalytic subunit [UDP-forming] [Fusarium mangiferae]